MARSPPVHFLLDSPAPTRSNHGRAAEAGGESPLRFDSPEFETDTSRTITPRESPAVGNVLGAPPRPRVPTGRVPAQGGPARTPGPEWCPEAPPRRPQPLPRAPRPEPSQSRGRAASSPTSPRSSFPPCPRSCAARPLPCPAWTWPPSPWRSARPRPCPAWRWLPSPRSTSAARPRRSRPWICPPSSSSRAARVLPSRRPSCLPSPSRLGGPRPAPPPPSGG